MAAVHYHLTQVIHNYIMLWGELLNGSCTLSPDPSDDMDEE
jgi:hypothetical protein